MAEINVIIADNIKKAMKEKGIGIGVLCRMTGHRRETMERWLSGARQPSVYGLYFIAKYLGTTMDSLMEGVEEEFRR